jgi:hypothetical protein
MDLLTRNVKMTSLSAKTGSTLDGIWNKAEEKILISFLTIFFELPKLWRQSYKKSFVLKKTKLVLKS